MIGQRIDIGLRLTLRSLLKNYSPVLDCWHTGMIGTDTALVRLLLDLRKQGTVHLTSDLKPTIYPLIIGDGDTSLGRPEIGKRRQ